MLSINEESGCRKTVIIRYVLALAVISAMGVAATLLQDRAVIYPPVAALALGLLVKKQRPWHVSLWQIPGLLALSALVGTSLSTWLSAYPVAALSLGFLFTGALLLLNRATLFPSLATCLLPIVLHTTSWSYPLSVLMLSFAVTLLSSLINRERWRSPSAPLSSSLHSFSIARTRHWLLMWMGALPLLALAEYLHKSALIAPPLLVVFVSLCQPGDRLHRHPRRVLSTIFLSACCGVLGRMVLFDWLCLPLFIVLPLTLLLSLFVMSRLHILMPPIAAISLLPFSYPAACCFSPSLPRSVPLTCWSAQELMSGASSCTAWHCYGKERHSDKDHHFISSI